MSFVAQWDEAHRRRLMRAAHVDARFERFVFAHYGREQHGLPLRAVDLGCGTGINAVWLAQRGWHVDAVDSSEAAIGRARQYRLEASAPAVSFMRGDVRCFAHHSGRYDFALEICVFENLDRGECEEALREAWRTLKLGGRFFALTASDQRDDRLTECGQVRKPDYLEMTRLLDTAGFKSWGLQRTWHIDNRCRRVDNWMVEAIK